MLTILLYLCSFLIVHSLVGSEKGTLKSKWKEIVCCFTLLFVFFGFRDIYILNDTAHYYAHFMDTIGWAPNRTSIFDVNLYDRFEKGYLVLENILAKYTDEPYIIICLSAFYFSAFFVYVTSKFSNNIGLLCFLMAGTCMFTFYSGLRQGLGSSLVTLGLIQLLDGKTLRFVLLTILGATFHSSCWFILPFAFLTRIKLNRLTVTLSLIIILVTSYYLEEAWKLIGKSDSIYLETSANRDTLPLASMMNFGISTFFLISTYLANKRNRLKYNNLWWWFVIINTAFLFLDISIQVMGRFSTFFYILSIIFWWKNVSACDKAYRKKICTIFVILIVIKLLISFVYRPEWYHLFPYQFYDFSAKYHNIDTGY